MNENDIPKYLTTRDAAKALMRKEATLYAWAYKGTGPITPVRVHSRLAWSAEAISNLLKGEEGGND